MRRGVDPFPADSPRAACEAFEPKAIAVRVEPMLRIQGYPDPARVRPVIKRVAQAMATAAEQAFQPAVRYRRVAVDGCAEGVLSLAGGAAFHCEAFPSVLARCTHVFVFVLTVGEAFDRLTREAQAEERLLDAVLLESAGWLGVEALTKQLAEHLRHRAVREGRRLTRRMAPGYSFKVGATKSEWSLYEQRQLFELFDDEPLPVRILESGAMLPKMSRSGLYGLKL